MSPDPSSSSDHPSSGNGGDATAVLAVNRAFYDAFEARDLDAMSDLWIHDDRVVCVHPGWAALRGWAAVASSWFALFGGPQELQFIITDEHVVVNGDVAWVHCDENLLTSGASATVSALNVFERTASGTWSMVAHHGAPIMVAGDDSVEGVE